MNLNTFVAAMHLVIALDVHAADAPAPTLTTEQTHRCIAMREAIQTDQGGQSSNYSYAGRDAMSFASEFNLRVRARQERERKYDRECAGRLYRTDVQERPR